MSTPAPQPPPADSSADQRLIMHNVSWSAYEAQLALRGEAPVPRVTYLDGAMELMSPSRGHERLKSYIACLVEAYALERGVEFTPYGSWTLRNAPEEAGLEPDECYILGDDQSPDRPNLAIEVDWTRGGLDKLEVYRRLGVYEVWIWRHGALQVHVLRDGHYERVEKSAQLPDLDLALLLSFTDRPKASQAIRAFLEALRR